MPKRSIALLALALGALGMVTCLAGIYAVAVLGSRLNQANERVFAMLDVGLAATELRVHGLQKRVQLAKISTAEVVQNLQNWGARKAEDRLVARLELQRRAEKLAGHLHQADSWLETSIESIRGLRQVVELGQLAGAPVEPASLDDVLERLTSLRSTLQQTEETLDEIHKFTNSKDDESEENRLARVTKLFARTLATIGDLDTRLEELLPRLAELRTGTQELQASTSHTIMLTTIGGFLLLAWIAAGQAALGLWGWKSLH